MSFFKKVFGGKKKSVVPNSTESVQSIKQTEELLEKKQAYLEEKIQHEMEIAKKNATTNKRVAMQALKRKKRLEAQLDHILATMIQLETQRVSLENTDMNAKVLETIKGAGKSLKEANKHMNADDVHAVIDDISEELGKTNEVTEALAGLLQDNGDDEELEKELEDLKQESLNDKLLYIPKTIPELPDVPQQTPKRTKEKDEEDLEDLMQWAN